MNRLFMRRGFCTDVVIVISGVVNARNVDDAVVGCQDHQLGASRIPIRMSLLVKQTAADNKESVDINRIVCFSMLNLLSLQLSMHLILGYY
jgi:hypothetical protein